MLSKTNKCGQISRTLTSLPQYLKSHATKRIVPFVALSLLFLFPQRQKNRRYLPRYAKDRGFCNRIVQTVHPIAKPQGLTK